MAGLEDQVVMITGCSSGIGWALAEEFARRGHRVLATARSKDSLDELASDRICTARLDVTESESIERAVEECTAWAGRIDIVVNNAGYALVGPVVEIDLDELRDQFETNLVGVVAVIQAVVTQMVARRSGRIVNIGSVSGVTATPFGGAYCATKAAIHMLSDALRMELAPFGVRVISVQPGAIESRFGETASKVVERYRERSLYSPVHDAIAARAGASQEDAMPASDFARLVVEAVTASSPRATLRAGKHSVRLPIIGRLPASLRDRIFNRRFGLERLQ